MSDLARTSLPPIIADAMEAVQDRSLSADDRAAVYAVLWSIQIRMNRAMKAAKDDLIAHLEAHGGEIGPLTLKKTDTDVVYACNLPENFGDITVQDAMAMLYKISPEFIRHVPEHYEINTTELGAAVHAGDPVARQLYRELTDRGWRTSGAKRTSLAVREAPVRKAA